jgi:hypothetical protein
MDPTEEEKSLRTIRHEGERETRTKEARVERERMMRGKTLGAGES